VDERNNEYIKGWRMKYEIIVPYATETTTVMYKYYWWSK